MELAREVGEIYGTYLTTFHSRTGQARADLFRHGDRIEAHPSFPDARGPDDVTDPCLSELRHVVDQEGYGDRIHLVYEG